MFDFTGRLVSSFALSACSFQTQNDTIGTLAVVVLVSVILVSVAGIVHRLDYYNKISIEDWRGTAEYVVQTSKERYGDKPIYVLAKNFNQIEKKEIKKGWIMLFELKQETGH